MLNHLFLNMNIDLWEITEWPLCIFKLEWSLLSRLSLESWRISYSHHYLFLYWSGTRTSSTGFPSHLECSQLFILFREVFKMTADFELKYFLHYFECKLIFCVHRVARGMSVCTICLLSVFQAVTISPRNSRWAELSGKAPKSIGPSSVLCWILHKLVGRVPMHMPARTTQISQNYKYWVMGHSCRLNYMQCSYLFKSDILHLGFIIWASGSIVFILYRTKNE